MRWDKYDRYKWFHEKNYLYKDLPHRMFEVMRKSSVFPTEHIRVAKLFGFTLKLHSILIWSKLKFSRKIYFMYLW